MPAAIAVRLVVWGLAIAYPFASAHLPPTGRPQQATPALPPDAIALVARLLEAKTDEERRQLLASSPLPPDTIDTALQRKGEALHAAGQYTAAAAVFRIAVATAQGAGHRAQTGAMWRAEGMALTQVDRLDEAETCYTNALAVAEEIGDEALTVAATKSLGILRRRQARYDEARVLYDRALAIARRIGDESEVGATLGSLGVLFDAQGDYRLALQHHLEALEVMRRVDPEDLVSQLNNLGAVYRAIGDATNALRYYDESLQMARKRGDRPREALVLSNLGSVWALQGRYADAARAWQQSLAIYEGMDDARRIASVLNSMGVLLQLQGSLPQAEAYLLRGLALRESVNDREGIANSLHNLSLNYENQGDFLRAHDFAARALTLREDIGERASIARTLTRIGTMLTREGRLEEALSHFSRANELWEAAGDRVGLLDAVYGQAVVQQKMRGHGHHEKARMLADRAVAMARELNLPERLWPALTVLAGSTRALGDLPGAKALLNDAIAAIEHLRVDVAGGEQDRQVYLEGRTAPFYDLLSLLYDQRDWKGALAAAGRVKARVLKDVVESGRRNVTKTMTQEEQDEEERLRVDLVSINARAATEAARRSPDAGRVANLLAETRQARTSLEAFRTRLYNTHPDLALKRADYAPVDLLDTASLLSDGVAVVEFAVAADRTYAFVLTRAAGRAEGVDLFAYDLALTRVALNERVATFRRAVGERAVGFTQQARGLYDELLGPARGRLKPAQTVLIIPDGPLWELPFQALQSAPGRYLLEDHAVGYAPSLTVLAAMRRERPGTAASPSRLLAVAADDSASAPALPQATRLIKSLQRVYGSASTVLLTGRAADERRIKQELPRYDVVHFASHGVLDGSNPMYSYLRVAPSSGQNPEDGLFEAWELMQLDLKADVLVLGACETALGRARAGEGVIGMTWAAFIAGSATTVVSQWKVDADSTADLMLAFHRRLAPSRGRYLSASRALRDASLAMLRSPARSHPFYWAGFVVVGRP